MEPEAKFQAGDFEEAKQELDDLKRKIKELEDKINDNKTIGKDKAGHNTDVGYRDKVRKKPAKTQSFKERSSSKPRRRSPYRHTVPSDKGIFTSSLYFFLFSVILLPVSVS